MLKLLQEGVNARTQALNKMDLSGKRGEFAREVAGKQGRIEDLTRKLARKIEKAQEADAGDGR